MILETVEDLKKYASIGQSFVFVDFQPYIEKATNSFTRKYIGNLHTELAAAATGENAEIKNEAREHLRSVITNFGLFMYMPYATVIMDSSGISTVNNDQRAKADWWQIKDIRRELLRSGHESMDLLLALLEANPTIFTDYATNYSSINKELLVSNATLFSKYYEINKSRQTYLALQPTIRLVEDQYIKTLLCTDLIAALKTSPSGASEELKTVLTTIKESIDKAIVSFTVSKVASIGLFLLDEKGLRVDFENYMDGRKQSPDYGKTADQVGNLMKELNDNGTNYLNIAKNAINDNLELLQTVCENPLIKSSQSGSGFAAYDTTGVLAL